jgi:hypothetical protein
MSPGITRFAVLNSKNGGVLRSLNADSSGLRYTAVDPSNGRIYYATQVCTGKTRAATHCRDAVKTLNPEGWRIVRTVPVAHAYQGILAVAARAHRVLIASPSSGTVTILQI